ncbi:unnamed protein product [Nyctereutes procyonoides]|uniref:(raccoon dog) hypothetical protein n=1 Tax=Nyctereutes procyonoides TaxID=34880 RepID=A0A811YY94_NYCPR|nr:unnamed protein product [Nyctereutes procyonoides]
MPLPLGKLVLFSSVVASGSCTLLYYLIQKKTSYYHLALEQLHSHPKALKTLCISLNLKILVFGSKSESHLYVSSTRDVFLKLKVRQQIPVFKFSDDTDDEVKKE